MAKYGRAASKSVESAMRRKKKGTLRSSTGQKVTNEKQAIAIGLSEAREKGAKVPPPKRGGAKKKAAKTSTARKSTAKKSPRASTTRSAKKR